MLLNLITNAYKFTDAGTIDGSLAVALIADDEVVLTVAVADTGEGISADVRDKLFSPYAQESVEVAR